MAFSTAATDLGAAPDTNTAPTSGCMTSARAHRAGERRAPSRRVHRRRPRLFASTMSAAGNRIAFASRRVGTSCPAARTSTGHATSSCATSAPARRQLVRRTAARPRHLGNSSGPDPRLDRREWREDRVRNRWRADLFAGDGSGRPSDVVLRDTAANTTELVSRAQGVLGGQSLDGVTPSLSANGSCVAFETHSDALVPMPPGTDFTRVVARALRGGCASARSRRAPPGGAAPVPVRTRRRRSVTAREHQAAPLPRRQAAA